MKILYLVVAIILSLSTFAQGITVDTIIDHYSAATVSQSIGYPGGRGYASGQAEDQSTGKAMFFRSAFKRSPEASLVSVLFDLETFNYTATDSFTVTIWADGVGLPNYVLAERKVALSDVDSVSKPIRPVGFAAYNLSVDIANVVGLGYLDVWIGLVFEASDSAHLALKATANGEFNQAASRTFTRDINGHFTDFVAAYNLNIALAIFPVFSLVVGIEDLSEIEGLSVSTDSHSFLEVQIEDYKGEQMQVSLIDLSGRTVKYVSSSNSAQARISLSDLPQGVYYMAVDAGDRRFGKKLVKL